MKPNLSEGVRLGAILLGVNLLAATGSYALGCLRFSAANCGVDHGLNWILHHPVFPNMIPAMAVFGFAVGAFGGVFSAAMPNGMKAWLSRYASPIAWSVVILLGTAFLFWGVPELYWVWRH